MMITAYAYPTGCFNDDGAVAWDQAEAIISLLKKDVNDSSSLKRLSFAYSEEFHNSMDTIHVRWRLKDTVLPAPHPNYRKS